MALPKLKMKYWDKKPRATSQRDYQPTETGTGHKWPACWQLDDEDEIAYVVNYSALYTENHGSFYNAPS